MIKLIKKFPKIDLFLLLAGLIATILVATFFFDSSVNYLSASPFGDYIDSEISEKEANVLIRAANLWPRAVALFINSPFLGNGFGSFNDTGLASPIFNDAHAHHSFLHFLSELGILGVSIFCLFFISFRKFHRKYRNINMTLADISYYSFYCILITSLTEHRITTPSSMLITMTLMGFFVSQVRQFKSRK